jgi:hypothetical protein
VGLTWTSCSMRFRTSGTGDEQSERSMNIRLPEKMETPEGRSNGLFTACCEVVLWQCQGGQLARRVASLANELRLSASTTLCDN